VYDIYWNTRQCVAIVWYTDVLKRVFNAAFNNISVILWRSILLVEETGENHRLVTSHWQTLSLRNKKVFKAIFVVDFNVYDSLYQFYNWLIDWLIDYSLTSHENYSRYIFKIKFVSDLWQVGGFLRFPPPIKLTATI
jgi:hypothetical protein